MIRRDKLRQELWQSFRLSLEERGKMKEGEREKDRERDILTALGFHQRQASARLHAWNKPERGVKPSYSILTTIFTVSVGV